MAANREFVLTDVRVPFWRMVVVLFKLTLAAIPAGLLAWLVITLLSAFLGALFTGGVMMLPGSQG